MATGDASDILSRVKLLIPNRWFAWAAPIRDAVLGGISDAAAWCYSWIGYVRLQTRLATATGPFLDIFSYDFLGRHLLRAGLDDDTFRARIRATILQERVTRAGMVNAITLLTGKPPTIFEPWNTGDAGAWGNGHFAWDAAGALGSTDLPAQSFLKVTRTSPSGVPSVAGWNGGAPQSAQLDATTTSWWGDGSPFSTGHATIGSAVAGPWGRPGYANKLTDDSTVNVQHNAFATVSLVNGNRYTITGIFKYAGRHVFLWISYGAVGVGLVIHPETPSISTVTGGGGVVLAPFVVNLGGGWCMASFDFVATADSAGYVAVYLLRASDDGMQYDGDGSSGVYVSQLTATIDLLSGLGGWDIGAIELIGVATAQIGVTDDIIYDTINITRPTGAICWTQLN